MEIVVNSSSIKKLIYWSLPVLMYLWDAVIFVEKNGK